MAYKLKFDAAYESIRGYVPPELQAKLATAVPEIEGRIESELMSFGDELATYLKSQIDDTLKSLETAQSASVDRMRQTLETMTKATDTSPASLQAAVAQLRSQLDEYERTWRGAGETLRKSALTAVRSTGLPMPG